MYIRLGLGIRLWLGLGLGLIFSVSSATAYFIYWYSLDGTTDGKWEGVIICNHMLFFVYACCFPSAWTENSVQLDGK